MNEFFNNNVLFTVTFLLLVNGLGYAIMPVIMPTIWAASKELYGKWFKPVNVAGWIGCLLLGIYLPIWAGWLAVSSLLIFVAAIAVHLYNLHQERAKFESAVKAAMESKEVKGAYLRTLPW